MAEETQLVDTPKSRRAVTTVFTDEEEELALKNTLKLAQDILSNSESSTPDRRWAAQVVKEFGQMKHGKTEVEVPHFRLSVCDVFGNFVDVTPPSYPERIVGATINGKSPRNRSSRAVSKVTPVPEHLQEPVMQPVPIPNAKTMNRMTAMERYQLKVAKLRGASGDLTQ